MGKSTKIEVVFDFRNNNKETSVFIGTKLDGEEVGGPPMGRWIENEDGTTSFQFTAKNLMDIIEA